MIWEQRGCAKSYPSRHPQSALTVEQYGADIIELTDMLRARFDEEKIYLVGHSWGTIIGVRAAQARPDLFHRLMVETVLPETYPKLSVASAD